MTARRRDLLAALGLAFLAFGWMSAGLLGFRALGPETWVDAEALFALGPTPPPAPWLDPALVRLDYPRDFAVADGLRHGRLDQWNPLVGCGQPLWADQGGPFFPLKLPLYLSPTPVGYAWFLFLRVVAAGVGAFLLARGRGLSPGPAFVAGALFQLSGATLASIGYGAASGMCLVPWALLAARLLATGAGPLVPALVLGMVGHSGHPTIILSVFLAFALALAGHAAALRQPRRVLGLLARSSAAGALGLALAAPALLPLFELASQAVSYKVGGRGQEAWATAGLQNRALLPLSWFTPGLMDAVRHQARFVFPFPFGSALGIGGLVLAVTGLLLGALDAALAAVLVVGAAMALAPPPLGAALQNIPLLSYVSPWYCWPLVAVPMTQAAAAAVARLHEPRARRLLLYVCLAVPAGIGVVFLLGDPLPKVPLHAILSAAVASPSGMAWLLAPPLLFFGGAAWAVHRRRWSLVGAVAVIELCVVMSPYNREPRSRAVATAAAAPSPAAAFVRDAIGGDGRMHVLSLRTAWPNVPMLFGLRDVRTQTPLALRRAYGYFAAIKPIDQLGVELTAVVRSSPLLDQAAVRVLVVERNTVEDAWFAGRTPIYQDQRLRVFANDTGRARARVAPRTIAVASEDEARALLPTLDADTVPLEPAAGRAAEPLSGEGTARIASELPDRVTVRAELARPGWVVLADAYAAGWEATVDGAPAPIHPATLLFRAVRADAGTHEIVFTYRPGFRRGVWIFVVAAILCAALGFLQFRGRRRQFALTNIPPSGR